MAGLMGIQVRSHSIRPALTIALALVAGLLVFVAQAAAAPPRLGDPGIGDRLFPTLGNGGYDARHYNLDSTYPTAEPHQTVNGEVTTTAGRPSRCRASTSTSRTAPSQMSMRTDAMRTSYSRAGSWS